LLSIPAEVACREAKISKQTVYRWFKNAAFNDELQKLRNESFEAASSKVRLGAEGAVDVFLKLMEGAEDEPLRIRCAQTILSHAVELRKLEGLEKRLAAIEEVIHAGR
jgi:AcrR family transcriptional regulator